MKNGFSIFIAAVLLLGISWCAFVLAPVIQLGDEKQTVMINSTDIYPVQRTGAATLGLQVYRANGCAACHTEQIQQNGMACDLIVTSLGKNSSALQKVLAGSLSDSFLTTNDLPKTIRHGISMEIASSMSDKITAAGGKAEVHVYATGADIERGWGLRRSVAEDFLWDSPVQLGANRIGPDLADVGARLGDLNWQLQHLYAPQMFVKGSVMPPFRYLFVKQKKGAVPSADALQIPPGWPKDLQPPGGYEIVPTEDAKNLAAYLLSLRAEVPLHDAPYTPAVAAPTEKSK
ncbi:MAG TPA: cbb3-type cytochrome c oxidase subunit II [Verrucomicrobiae bacterium]|nr:cbb3-type cytochrome c oxidase subunit II [Verrucomicrobiae bacterium]